MNPDPIASPFRATEVRYSLPMMLRDLELERASGSFAMEKLAQNEIGKLFKPQVAPRRVKPKK